jgi:hypothetical protein
MEPFQSWFGREAFDYETRSIDVRDGVIHWNKRLPSLARTMGTIGLAPEFGDPHRVDKVLVGKYRHPGDRSQLIPCFSQLRLTAVCSISVTRTCIKGRCSRLRSCMKGIDRRVLSLVTQRSFSDLSANETKGACVLPSRPRPASRSAGRIHISEFRCP